MPAGYSFTWDPNEVALAVLGKSSWAVLALTLLIELFTQSHYGESIREDTHLSGALQGCLPLPLKEESQHAILDELEWRRLDAGISAKARDAAIAPFSTSFLARGWRQLDEPVRIPARRKLALMVRHGPTGRRNRGPNGTAYA
jgi:hypothetical protein